MTDSLGCKDGSAGKAEYPWVSYVFERRMVLCTTTAPIKLSLAELYWAQYYRER